MKSENTDLYRASMDDHPRCFRSIGFPCGGQVWSWHHSA